MTTETSTRQVEPDITVMAIGGRLNLGNTLMSIEDAIKKLIGGGLRKLALDLSGLSYIDSSGIGMIVMVAGEMSQAGGRMRVAGAQGVVARAFELVRLGVVVPLDPDIETACSALSAVGGAARHDKSGGGGGS
jgi:anti-sigma B factor antagonist